MALLGRISLKGRALRLLSGREYSRAELERKLAPYALLEEEPDQLRRVLDDLQAKGFISDQRYVDSVVHRRASKLGAARIKHELQGKGVDSGLVVEAMARLKTTEVARAREVWERKFGALPQSAAERGRQMRFLASRGFGGETIHRVMAGASEPD